MLLDFQAVQAGRSVQTFRVEPDDAVLTGFFATLTAPLEVTARVTEQPHRSFLVDLRIEGEVEFPCRRCLTAVRQPISERTALVAEVRGPAASVEEEEDGDEELLVLRSLHDRVDLAPAVRDLLFLAADAYAVCSEACRGLCPRCGEDLNQAPCGCAEDVSVGPRAGVVRIRDA